MRIMPVLGIGLMLGACGGQPVFSSTKDPCIYVGYLAERDEAERLRREAEAKGRSREEVEMVPIKAGDRIPAAGKIAWARCRLQLARILPIT